MDQKDSSSNVNETYNFVKLILKFTPYWPYFLLSLIFFSTVSFFYLRYSNPVFQAHAKIQIIDKSQDSEMALPTAMTIFNRSMINLENEKGVISSYAIHKKVVSSGMFNIKFFSVGNIKNSEDSIDEWIKNYNLNIKINSDSINKYSKYNINVLDDKLYISQFDNESNLISDYQFNSLTTASIKNDLPFGLDLSKYKGSDITKNIEFHTLDNVTFNYMNKTEINQTGLDSDQFILKLNHTNRDIAIKYINQLIYIFDNDGIEDRQMEYKRTMDFVQSRSLFLSEELSELELKKQRFKENNNLTDIKEDAGLNAEQKIIYDSELFSYYSQLDLLEILISELEKFNYNLMPIDLGLNSENINNLISEFNKLIIQRNQYLLSAGPKNSIVLSIEDQIRNYYNNINLSLQNMKNNISINIENLEGKKSEFGDIYSNIPENEKILRSIERELEIKESLFLLLLQKKEEAAINYAVVNPSIKVVDYAMSSNIPHTPRPLRVLFISSFIALFIPFSILSILFLIDTKIHTTSQIKKLTTIPILGEIPYIKNYDLDKLFSKSNTRSAIVECMRIIFTNINFSLTNDNDSKVLLITSCIKGEGKTLISVHLSNEIYNHSKKVLLIGADLRNPQIHKYLDLDKSKLGITNYINNNKLNWEDLIVKTETFDCLLSGSIPPNPIVLLQSKRFTDLITSAKKKYDYVIIDSAPTILVTDTFKIANFADLTLFGVRSDYTDVKLIEFLNELQEKNKCNNPCIVLNCVGKNKAYKYNYSYNYSYNYGYGYGYSEET